MRRSVAVAATGGIALAADERVIRPWQERWGATDDEVATALPGDDLTAEPADEHTRAITIDAPPEQIWPWLVQLGADRGGFYSYTWLENVFGLDIHNADEIVPAWQDVSVGDVVWADRGRTGGWIVELIRPNQLLVLKVADVGRRRTARRDEGIGFEFQWTFVLRPLPTGGTRLLVRERVGFGRRVTRWVMAPVGTVSFLMTRRLLLGIKERAERTPSSGRCTAA